MMRRTKLTVALGSLFLVVGIVLASTTGLTTGCDADDGPCAAACRKIAGLCGYGSSPGSPSGYFTECMRSCEGTPTSAGSSSGWPQYVLDCVSGASECWPAEFCAGD